MSKKAFLILCCMVATSCTAARPPLVASCFTPGGNCLSSVVAEISTARSEIRVQTHSLNAKQVADALIKAKEAGVKVEIMLDKGSVASRNNAFYFANLNGIPTYLDARHAAANNNIIIIDNGTVISSSSTFEKAEADRNAESMLIVRSEDVAGSYLAKWNEHKAHAELFTGAAAAADDAGQEPAEKKAVKKAVKKQTKARRKLKADPAH